jgi:hypothetical protein
MLEVQNHRNLVILGAGVDLVHLWRIAGDRVFLLADADRAGLQVLFDFAARARRTGYGVSEADTLAGMLSRQINRRLIALPCLESVPRVPTGSSTVLLTPMARW